LTDKEHATLTGAFLHEPKGVETASANDVYIADGLGSGAWAVIDVDVLDTAVFPKLLHVRDEKASGTGGGSFTAGAWRTRTLNTVKTNEISGASLSSNRITLPAGTYFIQAMALSERTRKHVLKLYNITDSADTIVGLGAYSEDANGSGGTLDVEIPAHVTGQFTIASEKVFELQHRCTISSTTGFGVAASFGVVEVYADVLIWKLP
jgi:hypothetical protein